MPEYYKVNLDKLGKYPYTNYERIDGFTFKTIKDNKSAIELMTDEEKRIFLSNLSQNKWIILYIILWFIYYLEFILIFFQL